MDKLAVGTTEAARLLGISRPTLYRLIGRTDFPSFRVGGRVLISVAGLQDWIDRQTKEGVG
ncbi:MAG: helix-turn-helix domain-containing protein [Oscillospiraceae bacterium]